MPMSVETYVALGLDRQPRLEMNGRGDADFRLSLNHPGDTPYNPCAEAFPSDDMPPGEVTSHRDWDRSALYPDTRRDVWIYAPANLDRTAPANLIVFNDGAGYLARSGPVRATRVLDTLHARGEIAPTVAVFVNPGSRRDDGQPDWAQRRAEYDPLTSTYGRF